MLMYKAIVSIFQEIITFLHLQFTLFTLPDHVLLFRPFNLFSYIFFYFLPLLSSFLFLHHPAGFSPFHK